jgi:hypothetical protein
MNDESKNQNRPVSKREEEFANVCARDVLFSMDKMKLKVDNMKGLPEAEIRYAQGYNCALQDVAKAVRRIARRNVLAAGK